MPGIIPIDSIIGIKANEASKVILKFTKKLSYGPYLILECIFLQNYWKLGIFSLKKSLKL